MIVSPDCCDSFIVIRDIAFSSFHFTILARVFHFQGCPMIHDVFWNLKYLIHIPGLRKMESWGGGRGVIPLLRSFSGGQHNPLILSLTSDVVHNLAPWLYSALKEARAFQLGTWLPQIKSWVYYYKRRKYIGETTLTARTGIIP